jgi:hypothetical protein
MEAQPVKKPVPLALLIALLLTTSITTVAQEALRATTPSQTVLTSLSNLPEADALVFFNPPRILNEAVPKLMPEKDVAQMRMAFEDVKKNVGIDPTKIDYLVLASRFRKPAADLSFVPPEFMMVAGGDFSSDSLITLARMVSGGKLRDEKYGSKTLSLMTIEPILKEAEKNPILKSFSEVGIVALNSTTVAVGSPAYLRAAIDAGDGTGRISTENLNSLLRDPSVLISAAGSPWTSISKALGLRGTEANAREPRCDSQLGDFYVAVTMDAANFMLRGHMHADNPDTAKIINNLFSSLMAHATSVPDKNAQAALKALSFTAVENEVVLRADIPHQTVLDFIKQQTQPKKEDSAVSAPKTTTTPAKKKPTVRRKRRSTTN